MGEAVRIGTVRAAEPVWFAARTRFGQEAGIRRRLESLGVESFIPTVVRKNSRGCRSWKIRARETH